MKVKVNFLQPCSIQKFYDVVAKELGKDPEKCHYNPRKIFVGQGIFEKIKEYYRINSIEDNFGMDWVCYGPKVNDSLKPFEVTVDKDFIKET